MRNQFAGYEWIDAQLKKWVSQEIGILIVKDGKESDIRSVGIKHFFDYVIDISKPDHRGRCVVTVIRTMKDQEVRTQTILVEDPNDISFYLDEAHAMIVRGF